MSEVVRRTRSADNYEQAADRRRRKRQRELENDHREPPLRTYIQTDWNVRGSVQLDNPEFVLRELLKNGRFSRIHLVSDEKMRDYVMKIAKIGCDFTSWERENLILNELSDRNHENLVNMIHGGTLKSANGEHTTHARIMHRHGNSLLYVMMDTRSIFGLNIAFPVQDIQTIGSQILDGLQYLQSKNVMHLNLKLENIYFADPDMSVTWKSNPMTTEICVSNPHIRIGGFRHARLGRSSSCSTATVTRVQSLNYRAPEIFMCLPYSFKSDVWSVGCILCELYTCRLLFFGSRQDANPDLQFEHMQRIVGQGPTPRMWKEALRLRSPVVEKTSDGRIQLKRKLTTKPERVIRLVANLRDGDDAAVPLFEMLRSTLIFDPVNRPSLSEVASHFFFRTQPSFSL